MTREPKVVRAAFDDDAVIVYQACKPGQERILRISISHDGFRAALAAAVPRIRSTAISPDGFGLTAKTRRTRRRIAPGMLPHSRRPCAGRCKRVHG